MCTTTNRFFARILNFLVFGALMFLASVVFGQEALETVMAQMKPETVLKIHYQETRYLELLDQPWKGSGYFYIFPDGMIKEQWYPQRQIMAIKGSQLYYLDPFADIRYQDDMNDESGIQAIAFKGLMAGDAKLLRKFFVTDFQNQNNKWILVLVPKQARLAEQLAKIIISGLPDKPANKIEVLLADGDKHVMALEAEEQGEHLQKKVEQLLNELQSKS